MSTRFIGYDVESVRTLHGRTRDAIESLRAVASDDPAAATAIRIAASARSRLEDGWMPVLDRILHSDAMLSFATADLDPVALRWLRRAVLQFGWPGSPAPRTTDEAVGTLIARFDDVDIDGDGELSRDEIEAGGRSRDDAIAAACERLLRTPLVFANVALAEEPMSLHDSEIARTLDGGITPATLAAAVAQNSALRIISDPRRFAALDQAANGEIDGRVSRRDLEISIDRTKDPEVRTALEYLLEERSFFDRIDRDAIFADGDGRITYDQVYALALHQGAFDGVPDPTIPPGLPSAASTPVDYGDTTPQFLHDVITPQPGLGQVVIAMYIPTETAGFPVTNIGKSHGDDREPDPLAHPSQSRTWVVIDYETGVATARINPSCGTGGPPDDCHNPLPIVTDNGTTAKWWSRLPLVVDDSNRARFVAGEHGSTIAEFAVLNADKRILAPAINASFEVTPLDDGQVRIDWSRDSYPAMEAYHFYPDGRIVQLAEEAAAWSPIPGLLPDPWTDKQGAGVG